MLLAGTAAAKQPPITPGSTYLSLGDSVTFGYQEPQVTPPPNYGDPASFLGYPELLGQDLHLRVVNAACPGETSSSFIDTAAPSNGCEDVYRKAFPLHVRYRGSQLAFAVSYQRRHPRTRLVSLMIGANDVFLCQKTTADGCMGELNATIAKVKTNVGRIVAALRRKAHYRGQLAIVNYYSLNYSSSFITGVSVGLNTAMDSAARPFRARIADGFGRLRAAAAHSGGDTCAAGLLTNLGGGKCGVHPSYAGQALLALALLRALRL